MPDYGPPLVDGIWLWVYDNKIPIHPTFYLLKGDHRVKGVWAEEFAAWGSWLERSVCTSFLACSVIAATFRLHSITLNP